MSFFITSAGPGDGANLGGLEGADAHCQKLAGAAGAAGKTWRAYLSTSSVNARDRIGSGPWFNAKGEMIAKDVDELHGEGNKISKQTGLTEAGNPVNGRGDKPNMHDILTGSNADGTAMRGHDVQRLDEQWRGCGVRRPSRPHRPQGRCAVEILERITPVAGLRQGRSAQVGRQRTVLLLRGAITARLRRRGAGQGAAPVCPVQCCHPAQAPGRRSCLPWRHVRRRRDPDRMS